MKIRKGFVSNSSSSSFVIPKKLFKKGQIAKISKFLSEGAPEWLMEEYQGFIIFQTMLDNFDLESYLEEEMGEELFENVIENYSDVILYSLDYFYCDMEIKEKIDNYIKTLSEDSII